LAIEKSSGFVIKAFDYQESGRIVTLLSPSHGKISLLAKGARKTESRFGASLDLLNLIEVIFYEGKGLNLLRDASLIESYSSLKRDYERLGAAMQAARTLGLLLREGQGEGRVFGLFGELLGELNQNGKLELKLLQLGFKLKLIDLLGFGPELERCTVCRRLPEGEQQLWFSTQVGGVVCEKCNTARDRKLPLQLLQGWKAILRLSLGKLSRLVLPEGIISQGEEILDEFISFHLHPI
jgi:DNA repair protein RecO (recombination protein O)